MTETPRVAFDRASPRRTSPPPRDGGSTTAGARPTSETLVDAVAEDHLPERAPRLRAAARRELRARRRGRAGLHRRRFGQRRRRPGAARLRHLDQPARLADARPRADAARLARARRADDHRLGRRHRRRTAASTSSCGSSRSSRAKHRLPRFKLGYFYSEVDKDDLRRRDARRRDGRKGSTAAPTLDRSRARRDRRGSSRWPACIRSSSCCEQGADVIIGGRSSDSCVFAAPAMHHGFPESQAYYLGKVLECASFCAEPYGGKETVLGEITRGRRGGHGDASGAALHRRVGRGPRDVRALESVLRVRRRRHARHVASAATSRSTSGRRASPARASCRPTEFRVKLEGAGKVGERYVGMVGIRDPYTIANVDDVIGWARAQVRERFGESRLRAALHRLRPRRRHGRARAAARSPGARAVHPGAGRRADRGDGRRGLHDRHAADVLRAPARSERARRARSRSRSTRCCARARPIAGRSTTRCGATIRSSCFRRT